MYQIQTKSDAVHYDARENKYGRIVMQMEPRQVPNGYQALITDYVEKKTITKNPEGEDVEGIYLQQINSKSVLIESEKINLLIQMLGKSIPASITYFEREKLLFQNAFLIYVQNDPIKDNAGNPIPGKTVYNLNSTDWEIRTTP